METPTWPHVVRSTDGHRRAVVILTDTDLRDRFVLETKQSAGWPVGKRIDAITLQTQEELVQFLNLACSLPPDAGLSIEYVLVDPPVRRSSSTWYPIASILQGMLPDGDTPQDIQV